jgi:hypothetical protein
MTLWRGADSIKLSGEVLLSQLLEKLPSLAGSTVAEIGGTIARAIRTAEDFGDRTL